MERFWFRLRSGRCLDRSFPPVEPGLAPVGPLVLLLSLLAVSTLCFQRDGWKRTLGNAQALRRPRGPLHRFPSRSRVVDLVRGSTVKTLPIQEVGHGRETQCPWPRRTPSRDAFLRRRSATRFEYLEPLRYGCLVLREQKAKAPPIDFGHVRVPRPLPAACFFTLSAFRLP